MNEDKVSEPSVDDFLHGIKSGTQGEHSAWAILAAYLFWRRGGL